MPSAPRSPVLDKPLFFALVDGFRKIGVIVHDGRIGAFGRFRSLGFVGVVSSLVAEHVAYEEHQSAEDGEDHDSDDAYERRKILTD